LLLRQAPLVQVLQSGEQELQQVAEAHGLARLAQSQQVVAVLLPAASQHWLDLR
jgi:hypothetical protein